MSFEKLLQLCVHNNVPYLKKCYDRDFTSCLQGAIKCNHASIVAHLVRQFEDEIDFFWD